MHVDMHIFSARKIPSSGRSCVCACFVCVWERESEMHETYILNGGPIAVAHVGVAESLWQQKKNHTGHETYERERERQRERACI
jgi:hypothetical protein